MAQARPILTEQTLFRARPDVSIDGKRFIYASTSGAADQFNHLYVLPRRRRSALQDDLRRSR